MKAIGADEDDPFSSALTLLKSLSSGETKTKALAVVAMILRVAEIEDELERRGADSLIDEMAGLKKQIKETMIEEGVEEVYEETSGYEAVLQQRTSEAWDLFNLKRMLSPAKQQRYIVVEESIDHSAVAEGLKNGDLSRAELEYKGAVRKVPGSKALYVRRRKDG